NTGAGISASAAGALNNSFLSNSIHSNGALGIDLSPTGVTANDAGDADAGPNNLQNFPVLSSATLAGGALSVAGTLDGTAATQFRVEFFANDACDASGNGEGRTFLGASDVTTGAGGNAAFNVTLGGALAGQFITATATDAAGSTSEFSPCVSVAEGGGGGEGPPAPTVQFSSATFNGDEGTHFVNVQVTRTGDATQAATVDYSTSDGTSTEQGDYTTALGTLTFAPGEVSRSFVVLITDDDYVEENETLQLTLADPAGAALGAQSTATLIIGANDLLVTQDFVDANEAFVREHYHDFLNREPDADGLQFWAGQLAACGEDAQCLEARRVNVSASFFLSIEFQQTGFLVTRLHKISYGNLPRYRPFLRDTQEVSRGVVVGEGAWEQQLKQNKEALAARWAARPEFLSAFGGLSDSEFVDKLFENAGVIPSPAERDALVTGLKGQTETRAGVLLKVAESAGVSAGSSNEAFVLMQYFGYLRRNPDDPPDTGMGGFNFWLSKLEQFGGDFHQAEMVKAFLSANEYRQRFGPN
ncbi:MAG TPA: DUF4214 domain-containing protein, partial [Pyrinomonadaceae bacterium]|nr:DUF4214 domain-containing protein [Pyrinomonadaceae bacterium]